MRGQFLEEKAFKSRTVFLFGAISDSTAADTARRLVALAADSSAPIHVLVSSPGGVSSSLRSCAIAVLDAMSPRAAPPTPSHTAMTCGLT
jgi:ATP-dependent protease ClpP protease subunit